VSLRIVLLLIAVIVPRAAHGLDPRRSLSQYSRMVWTQEQGLPQDTIRAIAQTPDGYLWLGTDEGLVRFDGYEFVSFDREKGNLPGNSITALAAAADGSLWIGTSNGLTLYRDHKFSTFTTKQGLPDDDIRALYQDHEGTLWIVAGINLSRYQDGKFTNFAPGVDVPLASVRQVREDRHHDLWVAGFSAVVKFAGGKFAQVIDAKTLNGNIVTAMIADRHDDIWIGGSTGVIEVTPSGAVRRFGEKEGLPNIPVRALWEDRDANVWAGTNAGVARLEGDRFVATLEGDTSGRELVRCLFEDREGNFWVGSNSGLTRYRDAAFTAYGKSEGFPSDEPNTVFEDHTDRVWIGFHDSGIMLLSGEEKHAFTTRNGLPNNEVFSIRETPDGDLLIGMRGGLVRMHDQHFHTFVPPDPLGRTSVFDAIEDSSGQIWLATAAGLSVLRGEKFEVVVQSQPVLASTVVTLCRDKDGVIWAGTFGRGLWRVDGDSPPRQFTTADGLSSDQIRSLYVDPDGTLWVGTFGGGLAALRDGKFRRYTASDGLLSDNIAGILDDGNSLWLSTTRGICRISKKQLREFTEHRRPTLDPVNYGVEDGLRSAQCSPAYPAGGGGFRTKDGRLWFTTTRGLAVYDPAARKQTVLAPVVHLAEMEVDGKPFDLNTSSQLAPGSGRVQLRYTAVHLSSPEVVRYSYKLDNVDPEWVRAGSRRLINYNSLAHGHYSFHVRAEIPRGPASEESYDFEVLPRFYETLGFRMLCVLMLVLCAWAVYQLRLRQIRERFALVLEERARLAREIHDTLAQGFVGISSQLDAVAMCMPDETSPARKYLDLARRMARHSLTEARRSVMDLRASVLEGQDLASALQSGTRTWTAGSGVDVNVEVIGEPKELPQDMEQHLIRIAQEAVTNVLKHAGASQIWIKLHMEARKLYLRIKDNGHGFEQDGVFASLGGHFGLIGMRERAERLGGDLHLASHPGEGTEVEVEVPLP
jgi:signal transduction histidine kinase/ligand-binding sensor domain-containing protein